MLCLQAVGYMVHPELWAIIYALSHICTYACYRQTMDDLCGYSYAYKIDHISGVTCIYFIYNITWKTDFSMELVLLIGQCSFLCIKSLPVSIKISPRLLEELPDHNELACIKALWYQDLSVANLPSAKLQYPESQGKVCTIYARDVHIWYFL